MPDSIALYVHFPFCLSICPYCDFDRQATGFDRIDTYVGSVVRELERYADVDRRVHSIFFGGGTPSLMRPDHVSSVLEAARRTFEVLPDAEITLECNPGDADFLKLQAFRDTGANRVSFGVQSLDDAFLKLLGRRHDAAEARQAAAWAREAGFAFNLDFMFGLPGQTLSHWQSTLDQAVALRPDHLSCYLLTVDEKVPLGRDVARGRLVLPVDDDLAEMYTTTRLQLGEAGYQQYEISNWARPGQASRHNLTYWRDGEWLAVGAGGASSFGGRRWKNTPHLERYLGSMATGGPAACVEDEEPDRATAMLDFLTLGLRLREGVSCSVFAARFGVPLFDVLGEQGAWLLDGGVLQHDGDRLRIAAEHQLITNEILVRLDEPLLDHVRLATSASQTAVR
ncbi:MAG TPA: radical SAM family heme chaperone HemW [Chloroflexota bacterium]|jgi:oxygen-independent coproporphyrinogen-3 oxidase|nr:radical SAM family heme chaperone HemW [Chloroflexota bacterium]